MTKQQESNTARAPFAQQLERMHICITRLAHHAREAGKADPVALGGLLSQITDTVAELEALDDEIQRRREEFAAADAALEAERRRYKELFEFAPDGYLLTDLSGTIREGNRIAAKLLHTSPSLLNGKNLVRYIADNGRSAFEAQLTRLRFGESLLEWEARLRVRSGHPSFVSLSAAAVRSADGGLTDLHWIIRDIDGRKQTEEQLCLLITELERQVRIHTGSPEAVERFQRKHPTPEQRMFQDLLVGRDLSREKLDSMLSAVAVLDANGTILMVNRGWQSLADDNFLVGLAGKGVGCNYPVACAAVAGDGAQEARAVSRGVCEVLLGGSEPFEIEFEGRPGDAKRWFVGRAARVILPEGIRGVVAYEDITERKQVELRIEAYLAEIKRYSAELEQTNAMLAALATTDGLTNVKNHRALQQQISVEFYRARRYNTDLSLVLIDIDHFKDYNDTYGHPAGNEALRMVARSLDANARHADFVARFGGDEFVVLLPETGVEGSRDAAERICAAVVENGRLHGQVTVSVGAATLTSDMNVASALLEEADRALYESKARGRNCVVHLKVDGALRS